MAPYVVDGGWEGDHLTWHMGSNWWRAVTGTLRTEEGVCKALDGKLRRVLSVCTMASSSLRGGCWGGGGLRDGPGGCRSWVMGVFSALRRSLDLYFRAAGTGKFCDWATIWSSWHAIEPWGWSALQWVFSGSRGGPTAWVALMVSECWSLLSVHEWEEENEGYFSLFK